MKVFFNHSSALSEIKFEDTINEIYFYKQSSLNHEHILEFLKRTIGEYEKLLELQKIHKKNGGN